MERHVTVFFSFLEFSFFNISCENTLDLLPRGPSVHRGRWAGNKNQDSY